MAIFTNFFAMANIIFSLASKVCENFFPVLMIMSSNLKDASALIEGRLSNKLLLHSDGIAKISTTVDFKVVVEMFLVISQVRPNQSSRFFFIILGNFISSIIFSINFQPFWDNQP